MKVDYSCQCHLWTQLFNGNSLWKWKALSWKLLPSEIFWYFLCKSSMLLRHWRCTENFTYTHHKFDPGLQQMKTVCQRCFCHPMVLLKGSTRIMCRMLGRDLQQNSRNCVVFYIRARKDYFHWCSIAVAVSPQHSALFLKVFWPIGTDFGRWKINLVTSEEGDKDLVCKFAPFVQMLETSLFRQAHKVGQYCIPVFKL